MIKTISLLLLAVLLAAPLSAQIGVTALIKTTLTDSKTNSPLSVKYEITPSSGGVKVRGKSASDGTFDALLKPGETYTIDCKISDGIAAPQTFTTRASDSYYEANQKLAIKILKSGDAIGEWTLFAAGKTTLSSEKELTELLSLVKNNRGLSVLISIGGDVAIAAKGKVKKPKPAKKSKTPVASSVIDISSERTAAVNAFFTQKATPEMLKRISVQSAPPSATANVWAKVKDFKSFGMD